MLMNMVRMLLGLALLLVGGVAQAQARVSLHRESFAPAVARVAPSVVNIFAEKRASGKVQPKEALADPLLRELMGERGQVMTRVQKSLGSGVIVRDDGLFVTNYHVIQGASDVRVALADGREFPVRFVNADPKLDLAVLQLELPDGVKVPVATFGDASTLEVGDLVLAIGNPFGLGQSVSMGVVSAVGRSNANLSQYGQFIQTDATINPGNSGGALVDSNGLVVGINTAIFSRSGGSMGIGFAVPANLVQAVVRDIVTVGRVERPWLGAVGQNVTPALARQIGLPRPSGVVIHEVMVGSPAHKGGLKTGDVLLRLNGVDVADPADLNEHIVTMGSLLDRPAEAEVYRGGSRITLQVPFAPRPERSPADRREVGGYGPLAGYVLEQMTPALALEMDVPLNSQGVVVVRVNPEPNPLYRMMVPIMVGDVLTRVNGTAVATVDEAVEALNASARRWQLELKRGTKVVNIVTAR